MNAQLDVRLNLFQEGQGSPNYRKRLINDGQEMTNTTYKLKQSVKVMHENL